jgi:hypothetical protein
MKYHLFFPMMIVINLACHKSHDEPRGPVMKYTNLNDEEVNEKNYKALDIDNDGQIDLAFNTPLVGDPLNNRAILEFLIMPSRNRTLLLVNDEPEVPVLKKGDQIGASFAGSKWSPNAYVPLVQKFLEQNGSYWYGNWHHVSHQYLGIEVIVNSEPYFGWIELSMNTDEEKLVLHKMAISTEANVPVTAGD